MSNTQSKFYRNKEDLVSLEGIEVEAGSLWKENQGLLILEDEDQYVTTPFKNSAFQEVK